MKKHKKKRTAKHEQTNGQQSKGHKHPGGGASGWTSAWPVWTRKAAAVVAGAIVLGGLVLLLNPALISRLKPGGGKPAIDSTISRLGQSSAQSISGEDFGKQRLSPEDSSLNTEEPFRTLPAAQGSEGSAVRDKLLMPRQEQIVFSLNEGNRLLEQGKVEEAIACYADVLKLDPQSEDAHFNLGIALTRQGKIDLAIEHYHEALKIMPDYTEAHNNLGNLLISQRKFDEAIEHFKAALRVLPEHSSAHNNLGIAFARQGKATEAIKCFEQAVRLVPDYMEAHFNLGMAYQVQNRLSEAAKEFEEVLRLKPGFKPAEQALAKARAKLEQPKPSEPATEPAPE